MNRPEEHHNPRPTENVSDFEHLLRAANDRIQPHAELRLHVADRLNELERAHQDKDRLDSRRCIAPYELQRRWRLGHRFAIAATLLIASSLAWLAIPHSAMRPFSHTVSNTKAEVHILPQPVDARATVRANDEGATIIRPVASQNANVTIVWVYAADTTVFSDAASDPESVDHSPPRSSNGAG